MRQVDHVVDSLAVGGAERLVALLAEHQLADGLAVRIHALYGRGALADGLEAKGATVLCHGAQPQGLNGAGALYRAFRASRPDAVHFHNISATVVGAPVAALAGVPVRISTRHGWAKRTGAWKSEAKFWVAARACQRVVAVCEAARRELAVGPLASPSRLTTIVNGAEAPVITRTPQPPPDRCVVISVARLNWAKDHATLLRALEVARRQRPDLEVRLVGDGPERPTLEQLVDSLGLRGAVTFLGERADVGDCLADAHVFALSSVTEGLPVALLEGLAVGLVPVVTDVGGMPDVVAQAGVGRVVPPRDVPALAQALVDLAGDAGSRQRWAETARAAYQQHYTIARMCADYRELMLSCWRR